MKKLLLILVLIIPSIVVFSQATSISNLSDLSSQFTFEKSTAHTLNGTYYNHIDGTPFLEDEFILGDVVLYDSVRYEAVPLRYNIYSGNMEFKTENALILEIDMNVSKMMFSIGNLHFIKGTYFYEGKQEQGILQVLISGGISCYKKYNVELKEATKAIGYQDAEPNRFIALDDEYLFSFNDSLAKVLSKKELYNMLEAMVPGVSDYAKRKKIKIKKEEDLIKLVEYCNQQL